MILYMYGDCNNTCREHLYSLNFSLLIAKYSIKKENNYVKQIDTYMYYTLYIASKLKNDDNKIYIIKKLLLFSRMICTLL